MMRVVLIALVALFALAAVSAALAQRTFPTVETPGGYGRGIMVFGGNITGSGPPPSCSNALDFSKACNSQYISVLGIM